MQFSSREIRRAVLHTTSTVAAAQSDQIREQSTAAKCDLDTFSSSCLFILAAQCVQAVQLRLTILQIDDCVVDCWTFAALHGLQPWSDTAREHSYVLALDTAMWSPAQRGETRGWTQHFISNFMLQLNEQRMSENDNEDYEIQSVLIQ